MLKTDEFLYNKLIITCQKLELCKYTYYKLIDTLASFINNL
jgi:hypothetical protein